MTGPWHPWPTLPLCHCLSHSHGPGSAHLVPWEWVWGQGDNRGLYKVSSCGSAGRKPLGMLEHEPSLGLLCDLLPSGVTGPCAPKVFGEKESRAHLRLFSSFLLFWSLKKRVTAQSFSTPLHRREGSRFRNSPCLCRCKPECSEESAGLCRLLFGGKGASCSLEGAKPTAITWLGCCDRWHCALLRLCHEKWCWAAGTEPWLLPTAVVSVGSPGESSAQPSLCLPSPGELLPWGREGFPGASMCVPRSSFHARTGRGSPGLSLCLANHRGSTWVGVWLVKLFTLVFFPALFTQPRCNVALLCQGAFFPSSFL